MTTTGTELVFIFDCSGSMQGLEADTIGGYNAMLAKQKEIDEEAAVTTVLFNDQCKTLHERVDIKKVVPLTKTDYEVGGTTALLDAIGSTIQKVHHDLKAVKEPSNQVLFIITTDGMENASVEYSFERVKKLVDRQKELGWQFIFLGANIDAIGTASKLGIGREFAVDYHADAIGTQVNFSAVSETVVNYRIQGKFNRSWKKKIEADFKNRK
ncbi:vWA domain-containing protein [Ureibacillus sinduriensis]|uniref:VWFA domain-containing protein n=1 Tax=Ureibacillus sinduriensis BLB-1 = JCM 15800 TaxID=1384057 RepID=A0A0A3HV99_9BACL|nr:vWA domain-containing protein [Ureibacillus sinduriensis]KGR76531.1 hypothetical protein CD33_06580 [Ureibacillus sinduriensis BLB-1 = JCM 15800]